jgi:hypothetical protein
VLAASTRPLPPYKEWRSRAGTVPWQGVKDGGSWRWHFNGRTFSRFPEERGKLEAKVPPPLDDLRKFFADRPEFQDVQIVAFPVVDNPK